MVTTQGDGRLHSWREKRKEKRLRHGAGGAGGWGRRPSVGGTVVIVGRMCKGGFVRQVVCRVAVTFVDLAVVVFCSIVVFSPSGYVTLARRRALCFRSSTLVGSSVSVAAAIVSRVPALVVGVPFSIVN